MSLRRLRNMGAGVGLAVVAFSPAAFAQSFPGCTGTVFSTEEDFMSFAGEKYDGNPVVSDGDLIAYDRSAGTTELCARNAELIPRNLLEIPRSLGLDAVDVILPEKGLIAFSTELDETFDIFGHGDIIFPNGTVIPHEVLIKRFDLRGEHGLDAVHFTGEQDNIIRAIELAWENGPDRLKEDPEAYLKQLQELEVDIWFSIEGTTERPEAPGILDGDVLSAVAGVKVVAQDMILSPPIPAGIRDRGVDFGVDAVTADRKGTRSEIRFSTEILYRNEPQPFTDGDLLQAGGALEIKHEELIKGLEPKADFLGLDAVSFSAPEVDFGRPHLDSLCGRSHAAVDFGSDGLWRLNAATTPPGDDPRRPCGAQIPIDGTLPINLATSSGDMTRFRVVYESLNATLPPLSGNVETTWRLLRPRLILGSWQCSWGPALTLATSGGWMDAKDFHDAMTGNPNGITGNGAGFGCANPHLHLAVWNTQTLPGDRDDDLMRVHLEWETTGTAAVQTGAWHNIQLDNTAPDLSGLEVRLMDGVSVVPSCGEAPTSASQFQIWTAFKDKHFGHYTLRVEGGDPWVSHTFASPTGNSTHEYYQPLDDPFNVITDTGTTGTGLKRVRDIDMTELAGSFTRCCYSLRLQVWDSSIRHGFGGFTPGSALPNGASAGTSFEAGP
ncbi:hypothetical protein [Halovulum sp. GXIMD14793]